MRKRREFVKMTITIVIFLLWWIPMSRKPGKKPVVIREEPVRAYRVREALGAAILRGNAVAAADFKANCLSLMDEVRVKGAEFVITKHNKPVAKLVPVLDAAAIKFIGRGAGMMDVTGDIVSPTAPDWEEGADL